MNNLGVTGSLFNIMLAVTIIILALALAPSIIDNSDDVRNVSQADGTGGLNCVTADGSKNTTLNNFEEANCVATDLLSPFFILALLGIAGAIIGAKIVLQ